MSLTMELPVKSPAKAKRKAPGLVVWRGPSAFNQEPIGLVVTLRSNNEKTGPMAQAYIFVDGEWPWDAVNNGNDSAVCGDCKLRKDPETGRRPCYVLVNWGPHNVYRAWQNDRYHDRGIEFAAEQLRGMSVRLGAYGDPAMVPFEVWDKLLRHVKHWTGYTHQWKWCDPRFKAVLMASVDTHQEWADAKLAGWRTFRIMPDVHDLGETEVLCPASDEAGKKTTCHRCRLCAGQATQAKDVAIVVHGQRAAGYPYAAGLKVDTPAKSKKFGPEIERHSSKRSVLGDAIEKRRQKLGLSMRAVAKRADCHLNVLRRARQGETLRRSSIESLADALEAPRDEFLILGGYIPESLDRVELVRQLRKESNVLKA